jgi:hypothetical protein
METFLKKGLKKKVSVQKGKGPRQPKLFFNGKNQLKKK